MHDAGSFCWVLIPCQYACRQCWRCACVDMRVDSLMRAEQDEDTRQETARVLRIVSRVAVGLRSAIPHTATSKTTNHQTAVPVCLVPSLVSDGAVYHSERVVFCHVLELTQRVVLPAC